jgi:hypothetical protein
LIRTLTLIALPVLAIASVVNAGRQDDQPTLRALLEQSGVRVPVAASCRGEFRAGHPAEFAVAAGETSGGRYLVVQDDARLHELAAYSGKADLACYTVREADRLNATIAQSDTINGRVTAEWDGTVVCGFIEPTIAVCWQFAPEQGRFVRIGGWTT